LSAEKTEQVSPTIRVGLIWVLAGSRSRRDCVTNGLLELVSVTQHSADPVLHWPPLLATGVTEAATLPTAAKVMSNATKGL